MKYFALLLFLSPAAFAQTFITGQGARLTIGQTTFTSAATGNISQFQLGAVGGVAYANNTLFVVDSNHIQATPVDNRVLIYNNISQWLPSPTAELPQGIRCPVCFGLNQNYGANIVLGQPDFVTTNVNTAGPSYSVTGASDTNPIVVTVSGTPNFTVGETVDLTGVNGNTAANGVWQISAINSSGITLEGAVGNGDYTSGGVMSESSISPIGMRTPTAVATNGQILAVADTDNNRVLIWNSIPTTIDQPANVVVGQPNMTTLQPASTTSTSLRGPEGVWIQGNQLFVADTQNHRVLIWNSIPSQNGQPADLVLGEPNFTTAPPITVTDVAPTANNLYSPVSVSSDGQHLFVADLGHSRVLIWNSIPTQNQQPADVEIGQPNMTTEGDNNVLWTCVATSTPDSDSNPVYPAGCTTFCPPDGFDSDNNPLYSLRCGLTLSFPRFVLSDGQRLYIADGGNDRILIYNSIPTQNAAKADIILGQPDEFEDLVTDASGTVVLPDANVEDSAPSQIRSPMSMAWDGTNLYVADPYDRRVLVFTVAAPNVPITGIVNAASQNVYAVGGITFSGTITANDTITITINSATYTYKVVSTDTLITLVVNITNLINSANSGAGDPNVIAVADPAADEIVLVARSSGPNGNNITYSTSTTAATSSGTATETATAAGSTLSGGQSAAEVAPGTVVFINGTGLADAAATGSPGANGYYPNVVGGVQVYFDGIEAPIVAVSPTQITTQIPYEVADANGISAVVRTTHSDGTVTTADAISVPIVTENPGIFAGPGSDPRPGIAYHSSSNAIALVDIEGQINGGDTATITIEQRNYTYTIQDTDSLTTVRDAMVVLINSNPNEKVIASPTGEYTRVILTAKTPGPDGNGIAISVSSTTTSTTGTTITISTLGNAFTCCASAAGTQVTPDNPAVPGEVITVYATGLGLSTLADGSTIAGASGQIYEGPAYTVPETLVDNAQVGGLTANVLSASLAVGQMGIFEVKLQLDPTLPTDPLTEMYIAQSFFTSNIVTIPVVSPTDPPASSTAAASTTEDKPRAPGVRAPIQHSVVRPN